MSQQPSLHADHSENQRQTRLLARRIFRTLWIATGVALLCLIIFLSMGQTKLSESGISLVVSLVYSVLISLPSMFLLNWIGFRCTEKYPRLSFLFIALALWGATSFGLLAGGLLLQVAGIYARCTYWHVFWSAYPFSLAIALVVGLTITAYETLRHKLQSATLALHAQQMERERANKLLAEAQLASLESRIHPHFLFNTLNSIAALIPSSPQLAEDTVGKLAALLRYSLNAPQRGLVPLAQELKIVRDYLEIEKTRFGARLTYEIDVPNSLDDVKAPPLALQSLVENVVKHVVARQSKDVAIRIAGREDSGRVCLEVIDDGPGFSLDAIPRDHGLGNLIARLELLFGNDGALEVTREDEKTVVRLSFPASGSNR